MAFITVLSIVVFRYISQAEANSPTKSSCFPAPPENGLCKSINISCPLGSVIYKPNIDASSDECPASGQFFQNTEPPCVGRPVDLYADINDCYWKQSCLIKFPLTPIFTRTCVNQAQSIKVHDWICIKAAQNSVYFKDLICKSQYIGTHANSGVILSHKNIPWNYDRTMFDEKPEKTCETSITVPTAGGSRVLIEISLFDIDMQNDQLTINEIMVEKEDFRKEFPPYTQVNIKFSSKTRLSKSGKGFVICFRRINKQESNDKSACDGIFEFGKEPKLAFDEDMQLEQGTTAPKEESTTTAPTVINKTTKPTHSTDQQCTKCLEKKRPKEKCKILCCKVQITHPQCQSLSSATTTATSTQGKCKVKKSRIDKLCKNCVKGKIKCAKKENCHSCCPGKTISTKCRKGKGGRNKNRKDKKKKKKRKVKNGS